MEIYVIHLKMIGHWKYLTVICFSYLIARRKFFRIPNMKPVFKPNNYFIPIPDSWAV